MSWWRRNTVPRCELCSAKLPTGSVIAGPERVYAADGETRSVFRVCAACRRRHLALAAEAEVRFRRENSVEDVCARLREHDEKVRFTAAGQLARLGDRRAVAALRDALARERSTGVVEGIADALVALGGPEAESALIAGLHDVSAWHGSYSGDQPIPAHAELIAGALVRMGGVTLLLRVLFEMMMSKTLQPSIREHAARYLCDIAYRSAAGHGVTALGDGVLTDADRELMVESLRAVLRDESAHVRERAAVALGHLGNTTVLPDLLDMLGDENGHVRYFTAQALGDLGDRRAVPALRQAAENDPKLVVAVREALAKLK